MTTLRENIEAIEKVVSDTRVEVCPAAERPYTIIQFNERQQGWIKFLHVQWLKEHPEVECSCR